MRYLILMVIMALSACAPTVVHPTKGPAGFSADSYECDKDTAAVQNHIRMVEMHRACMLNKGWRVQ